MAVKYVRHGAIVFAAGLVLSPKRRNPRWSRSLSSRMLKKAYRCPLPGSRGSVNACKHAVAVLSRARKQAVSCLFQQPAKVVADPPKYRFLLLLPNNETSTVALDDRCVGETERIDRMRDWLTANRHLLRMGSRSDLVQMSPALLAPNLTNTLVIPQRYVIELYIDPAEPRIEDDVYVLLNEDGTEHQRRTIRDDAILGDDKLTLVFAGMRPGLRYSLLIDEGAEGKYYAFYRVLLEDLIEADSKADAVTDEQGGQALPEDYNQLTFVEDLPLLADESQDRGSYGYSIQLRNPAEGADDSII